MTAPVGRRRGVRVLTEHFGRTLFAITLLALVVRLVFALGVASDMPFGVDANFYRFTATSLTDGDGFTWVDPDLPGTPVRHTSTQHGPVASVVLAISNLVGFDTWDQHRMWLSLVGAVGVGLTGLLGRRIGGPAVGLGAAAIGALHPLWFQAPGFLTAEAAYFAVVPALLLVAHVAAERRTLPWMAGLGALCAVATLTRSEAVLFVGVLALPVALLSGPGRRLRSVAVVLATTVLVVAPWVAWIHARTGQVTLSTNGGITFAGSNCETTYYGPQLGEFNGQCALVAGGMAYWQVPPGTDPTRAVGIVDAEARQMALDYVKTQERRLPVLVAARLGRTLGVFRPWDSVEFDRSIGAQRSTQRVGYAMHYVLMPLALGGIVLLVRRRRIDDLVVLLSGPVVAIGTGVLVYGATRMRVAAEPAIAVLAAYVLVRVARIVVILRE